MPSARSCSTSADRRCSPSPVGEQSAPALSKPGSESCRSASTAAIHAQRNATKSLPQSPTPRRGPSRAGSSPSPRPRRRPCPVIGVQPTARSLRCSSVPGHEDHPRPLGSGGWCHRQGLRPRHTSRRAAARLRLRLARRSRHRLVSPGPLPDHRGSTGEKGGRPATQDGRVLHRHAGETRASMATVSS